MHGTETQANSLDSFLIKKYMVRNYDSQCSFLFSLYLYA